MKTVNNVAAETAKTRDSYHKNLCPIVTLDDVSISSLAQAQDLFPLESKDKKIQAVLYNKEGKLIGIINYLVAYLTPEIRKAYIKGKVTQAKDLDQNSEVEDISDDSNSEVKEENEND